MGLGHSRALEGKSVVEGKGVDPGAGGLMKEKPSAPFDDIPRRFVMFRGPNDLRILRNKDHYIRIEDSFATVQESYRSDFGASRKAPKTKGHAEERSERRPMTEPRSSPTGELSYGAWS